MTDHQRIADSYVQHILIAVEAGDHAAPFRDFLDNWFAYTTGGAFLSSGARPVWFNNPCGWTKRKLLGHCHFVSRDAQAILDNAAHDPKGFLRRRRDKDPAVRLMVDHAVPITVMRRDLFDDPALRAPESIGRYLRHRYRLGLITAGEDRALNLLGLRRGMPLDWDGCDTWGRYTAANIESDKVR